MKSILKVAFLFVLSVFLYSCSCNYHIKKINDKCDLKQDTIYRIDTMYSKEVFKDSIFKFYSKDTIIVKEGKLTMKYFYRNNDSTVYLWGKCDTDTIIKRIPVAYNVYKQSWYDSINRYILIAIISFIIALILKRRFLYAKL